jgi:hypothetical protein
MHGRLNGLIIERKAKLERVSSCAHPASVSPLPMAQGDLRPQDGGSTDLRSYLRQAFTLVQVTTLKQTEWEWR